MSGARHRIHETPLLAVYDGRRCLGHILARGKLGFEGFDADDQSLGLFTTQAEVAAEIFAARQNTRANPGTGTSPLAVVRATDER